MEKKDKIFIIIFTVAILGTLTFMGISITGLVTDTTYCKDGVCYESCTYNPDCLEEDCLDPYECRGDQYQQGPEVEDVDNILFPEEDILQSPSLTRDQEVFMYIAFLALIIFVGITYFILRKRNR
jgi:hypothetical protein